MDATTIVGLVAILQRFKYPILIPLAAIEGPILMMLCGLGAHLGYISFWPAYICLALGDLVGDAFWYWLGYHYGERFVGRFGSYFSITETHIDAVKRIFHRYRVYILLISKVTAGFGLALATLFTAGMTRVPFPLFIALNAVGQLVWTGILMGIGFFLGTFYTQANNIYGKVTAVAAIFFVFLLFIGFSRYIRSRFERTL
ncbi:MAG: DedA family protein [Candidatus Kaiserbacteria bacterium]|nr:DedA family protein [Candidatus Kaiserbacteria bacterium]